MKPKKVDGKSAALQDQKTSVVIDHDSRGYPKVRLVLPLDILEKENKESDGSFRPRCLVPLDPEFLLGEMRCVKGAYVKKNIYVRHVDQICYRDPQFETIKSKESLNLPECKNSEVLINLFEPRLRIDTEAR